MQPESGDNAYLWDMLDAARAIGQFIEGKNIEIYTRDRMLRGAVERHVEIIGEAARNISPAFRAAHPEIPWAKIVAQRNVLVHDYGEIKHERIWVLAERNIPKLITQLESLLPNH